MRPLAATMASWSRSTTSRLLMYSERSDASDSSSTPYVVASGGVCRLRLALVTNSSLCDAGGTRPLDDPADGLAPPAALHGVVVQQGEVDALRRGLHAERGVGPRRAQAQALLVAVRSVRAICVSVGREHQVQCVDIDAHTHARCRRRTATTVRRRTTRR